jgi:hypothetical protein
VPTQGAGYARVSFTCRLGSQDIDLQIFVYISSYYLALATDLNWIFNHVGDVLKHHTTAYMLHFCDESAARLFFNYLVQTT